MDLLTDILRQAGLRRRLLDLRQVSDGGTLQFPCDKSIGLHIVTQGRVFVHAPGLSQPLALQAGDIAVMARGCTHHVGTQAVLDPRAPSVLAELWSERADEAGAGADAAPPQGPSVISGAYQFWHTPLHPFFREIPDWTVLRADSLPRLGPLALTVGLLDAEVQQRRVGADIITHGLLDVIFTYVLRELVERAGHAGATWSQAITDGPVRKALALMHEDCARPWTLDELAARAGVSRTGLAERFRQAMGDTPLSHLRTLRMQKAMSILGESAMTLEQVAQQVGYQDAFGFSKVFKRTVGLSPREFRQRDAQERLSPWRFATG